MIDRDEIISMAREAGFITGVTHASSGYSHPFVHPATFPTSLAELERFAALVAAAEREACAMVCSERAVQCESEAQRAIENGEPDEVSAIRSTAWQISVCAAAIRARSQA